MSDTLRVKATHADRPVPMIRNIRKRDTRKGKEGRDANAIYHDEEKTVPNVRYYRKRCRNGDLIDTSGKIKPRVNKSRIPAPKKSEDKPTNKLDKAGK